MSGKSFGLAVLVAVVLGLGPARSQQPASAPPGAMTNGAMTNGDATAGAPPAARPGLSRWILYDREPGCCGPVGHDGPIGYEIYLRSGASFPVGNSGLGGALDTGWVIEGGARTLLFNPAADAAWTIDLGLGNIYNRVGDRSVQFPLKNIPSSTSPTGAADVTVTGSDLNRTYVYLAGGREWYLWGSAEQDGCNGNWRVGVDVGGQYGTEKLDLNEIQHQTDTIGAVFVAVHSDVEFPCGACIFQAGLRLQYTYTWSDILQVQNNADVQEFTLQGTFGIRF